MNKVLKIGGLPVKAKLERVNSWKVTMRECGKHVVFSFERDAPGESQELSQRPVREAFMAIDSPVAAFTFFEKYGPFQRKSQEPSRGRTEAAHDVQFAVVQEYQELWRAFIADPAPECFRDRRVDLTSPAADKEMHELLAIAAHERPRFTVEMGHDSINGTKVPAPFLEQRAFDVETAVYNSIYIDKMAGLKGAMCARDGCQEVFLSDSDKPRRFCTDRCSNAHRQQQYRKSQASGAARATSLRSGQRKPAPTS